MSDIPYDEATAPIVIVDDATGYKAGVTSGNKLQVDPGTVTIQGGNSTSVKVTGAGTAGSADTGVVTIQGIANAVAVPCSMSSLPSLATGDNTVGRVKITDGTNVATVSTAGSVHVVQPQIYTYSATGLNIATGTAATDIFTLTGSATKTVKVFYIELSGTQTTTGTVTFVLLRRSTANTGGTLATPTITPFDSTNPAATAVFRTYTANPTSLGTLVGNLSSTSICLPSAGDDVRPPDPLFSTVLQTQQPIVLRGTGEVLSVNLNGTGLGGDSLNCTFMWTEE